MERNRVDRVRRLGARDGKMTLDITPTEKLSRRQRRKLREQQQMTPNAPVTIGISDSVKAVEQVAQIVERATKNKESKQPRFQTINPQSFLASVASFIHQMDLEAPDTSDPRRLDEWYRRFAYRESYLSGVFNSVVQIDKNRGWKIIGGRNQVARYTKIAHEFDNGAGWRPSISICAQSYYTTRAGFVVETGTEGDADNAPLRALWTVDPCRVKLTGNLETPLKYYPRNGSTQDWLPRDFIRGCSLPSTDETQYGYGFPAIARCLDLARIMVAVYQHDTEQLGARAPRGLLLLNGISQNQWDTAMQSREESLDGLERAYFGGVAVLASSGANEVSATLTALSNLPKDWDTKTFTDLLLYGYALAFGYDAREFYPVSGGSLGTATETETQHRKASSKGDLDFSLAFQEKLQSRFPATLQFEFEQRDVEGEQNDAALQLAQAQVITEMTKWQVNTQSVLTQAQILQLAAEANIIPEEWTPTEEDVTTTDTDSQEAEARWMENARVRKAIEQNPGQEIVEYSSKTNRTRVLVKPTVRKSHLTLVIERASIETVANRFKSDLRGIVTIGFTSDKSILSDVRSIVKNGVGDAYVAGLAEGGVSFDEMDDSDAMMIVELASEQLDFVTDFVRAVREAKTDRAMQREILDSRIGLWAASISAAGAAGLASAKKNEMVRFGGEDGEESCKDCQRFKNEPHRRKYFLTRNLLPGKPGSNLTCGGFACRHTLVPVK
jgi:hypothetical protein